MDNSVYVASQTPLITAKSESAKNGRTGVGMTEGIALATFLSRVLLAATAIICLIAAAALAVSLVSVSASRKRKEENYAAAVATLTKISTTASEAAITKRET